MAGRHAKPLKLHIAQGNPSKLSKAEIKERAEAEVSLGSYNLECPAWLRKNKIGWKKWKEVEALYAGSELATSADVGMIARYCAAWSEYHELVAQRKSISAVELDWSEYAGKFPEDFQKGMERLMRLEPWLKIDSAINKKSDQLCKMEDRLYLNILARSKTVAKPQKKKPADPLQEQGFGNL